MQEKKSSARMARTRRTIIDGATELFLARGFAGTSMEDVALASHVSKQTVYAHFGSKEALFLDIVHGMTGGAGDRLQEQVADPSEDTPLERFLLDFADRQLILVLTPRLMRLRRLVIAEVDRFPQLGKELHAQGPGRSIKRLSAAFATYRARGLLAAEDTAQAAGFFNWLIMGGPVNDAMLLGDEAAPDADRLRAHAREAVRIFLAAYRAAAS